MKREKARHDDALAIAAARGWRVDQGAAVAHLAFDDRLVAERVTPVACALVIDGGTDAFVAESWELGSSNPVSPFRGAVRQHILRLPSAGIPRFLVKGVPRRNELRFFPRAFKDQAGFVRAPMMMVVAGDFIDVHERLGPLIQAIHASRVWVIGLDDELIMMSAREPDGAELELRLGLARAIVTALS